jgi:hypothetical protein
MRTRRLLPLIVLASTILACNLPLFAPAATATAEIPTATSTNAFFPLPSATAEVVATVTPTVVPTPSVPEVTPISANVNCRSGPDTGYDSVSVLFVGGTTQVAGRLDDTSWWYVHDPSDPGSFCWIFSGVVTIAGPTGGIPIIPPPPAIVTKVTVDVNVPSSPACGGPNPVDFSGSITTNGTATVKYQWEITGDKTNTTSPETLGFSDADTKDVPSPGAYNVDCGSYKITLHILSPNDTSAGKKFKVAAP